MTDTSFVVIPVVAMALICLALVGILAFVALRFGGNFLRYLIGGMRNDIQEIANADETDLSPHRRRSSSPNLRAQADKLDFNAAVERHKSGQAPPPNRTSRRSPPSALAEDEVPSTTRRRRSIEEEDFMDDFGGLDGE